MRDGSDDKPIIHIIDELLDYTDYHFREEERVMREVRFPDLGIHKEMHENFVRVVTDFHSKSHDGMAIFVATNVSLTGLDWLKVHILGADKKYHEFMEKHGMKLDDY
jgi:hemerythrin-like metal-binding protein